jgi:hypothetical protein
MSGNDRHGIVIQERDRHFLRELAVMRVVDREQAKIVAGSHPQTLVKYVYFRSDPRAVLPVALPAPRNFREGSGLLNDCPFPFQAQVSLYLSRYQ